MKIEVNRWATPRLAALAALAALIGCGGGGPQQHGRGPVAVEVAEVRGERVADTVRAVGTLRADEEVVVRAERDGRVRSIHFEEGSEVAAGDLLVVLDAEEAQSRVDELQARVRQAQARLEEERGALERRRPLRERQLVSEEEFRSQEKAVEAAEAELEAARAALRSARKRLRDMAISAPVGGAAGLRRVSVGDYVEQSDPIVAIYDSDPLEVTFQVPERYLSRVGLGKEVRLRVAAFSDDSFGGEVVYMDPSIDPVTRTVVMKAAVPNPDGTLRPGLFAQVDVLLAVREDSPVVPEEAIVPREDGDWVFVVEEETARRRRVRVGQRLPGRVELLEGVVPGDTVVTAGQQKLAEGAPVRIIEDREVPAGGEG